MKYLKKFESKSEDDLLEDLSEYLQELFDKYGIVEYKGQKTPLQGRYLIWYRDGSKKELIIEGVRDIENIEYELISKRELIEYRLGSKLSIKKGPLYIILSTY